MLELGLKVLLSYLAGALNGALIVGRLAGGIDIRTLGSGNAGGTNALRTQGKWFAFRVMVIDVGKGYLPPWLLPALALPGVPLDPEISRNWLALACAGAAVVGHCYPVWFDFKGGKGAATAIGALLALAPALTLPALVVWCLVLTTTGFVGLATMLAAAVLPVWAALTRWPAERELVWFLVALALFIVYTHRGNIQRLREGRENRLEKAMLWRRSR
ncbi:MAG: glycerol-3-phosphate 1-O-acyltransferase PlsY [Gammaproteobacteria bacterium]|nr:glycerol-3-phosphate 1-O-acyltransferase PlsY [Gammaproteobacteria bacterium]